MTNLQKILIQRHYLSAQPIDLEESKEEKTNRAYLNAFLLSNFGIVVDKPHMLTSSMVKEIQGIYKLDVPESFYKNPQDTKYYSRAELFIEQLVSYFLVETGTGIYSRPEIFEKDLPEYKVGNEIKLREFKIVMADEADEILKDIAKSYCDYTRPFGVEELEEFVLLFKKGYVDPEAEVRCKDNIFALLKDDIKFASFLDQKDLVKLSIKLVGEKSTKVKEALREKDTDHLIERALPLVRRCSMTKKQAKFFNKLLSIYSKEEVPEVAANSPHKKAVAFLKEGKVIEAAKVYAKSGSLLERNLRMLLSRANPQEALEIIGMVKAKNPMVLYQLIQSLEEEAGKPRTFTFFKNNLIKHHTETDYETKWRKSRLSSGTIKFLHKSCVDKIYDYYKSLEKLGKVYIADSFYKLGVPSNTSASGKGIDVIPTGSRLPINGSAVRTFVTWTGVYDIDASLTLIKDDNSLDWVYFGNYSMKRYGNSILFSGDVRDQSGTEYYDIKLDEMRRKGFRYIIQSFHGFNGRLDQGDIHSGYQVKDDLNTRAWDPKNIETQFKVFGDTRACQAFAIDLETKEVIILNLMVEDESRVGLVGGENPIARYLKENFLEVNIGSIVECRGEKVSTPEEADVVFDDKYDEIVAEGEKPAQKIIRSWELEKLVSLVNSK